MTRQLSRYIDNEEIVSAQIKRINFFLIRKWVILDSPAWRISELQTPKLTAIIVNERRYPKTALR